MCEELRPTHEGFNLLRCEAESLVFVGRRVWQFGWYTDYHKVDNREDWAFANKSRYRPTGAKWKWINSGLSGPSSQVQGKIVFEDGDLMWSHDSRPETFSWWWLHPYCKLHILFSRVLLVVSPLSYVSVAFSKLSWTLQSAFLLVLGLNTFYRFKCQSDW